LPHGIWLVLAAAITTLGAIPGVDAYSWNFHSPPQQCGNLTIDITGSDGTPPFHMLIIPFGATPLPNNIEARKITEQVFPARSGSFQLNYPANSQFVAVVSDAKGFGSGGTSVAAQVTESKDSSCFDGTKSVSPPFFFSIEPPNQVVQCQSMRIWWDPSAVQGTPNFFGVIPGGQSFAIPQGEITRVEEQGLGFSWVPNVRTGTTLMIVGGDNRGNGTGGSIFNVVSGGIKNDSGCLKQDSPSSTPGSPAGGSYPTSSTGAGVGGGGSGGSGGGGGGGTGGGGGGSNTGAIVGGVVGGVAFITAIILAWFFLRRRSKQKRRRSKRSVDLLNEDEDDDSPPQNPNHLPHQLEAYYAPEPFMVPDTSTLPDGTTADGHGVGGSSRPMSGTSQTYSRSGTPDVQGPGASQGYAWAAGSTATSNSRKGAPPRMRPVNIVQHEDAGPPLLPAEGEDKDEPETVELPPAYTAVRGVGAGAGVNAPGDARVAPDAPRA